MRHKGVRIELLIAGRTYLDINSYVAHLQGQLAGEPSISKINASRGIQIELRLTPVEIDDTEYRDEG